jgi:Sulfotransferase domain
MTLPNFLLIGAQKSGTTWLAAMLAQHPEIFSPKVKELHFFDLADRYARGLEWYEAQFEGYAGEKAIGEATPNYLGISCEVPEDARNCLQAQGVDSAQMESPYPNTHNDIAALVHKALPDAKLIVLLRNPVDRAISSYFHHIRMRRIPPTRRIVDACTENGILSMGFYYTHLERWLRYYPRDRFLVLFYEQSVRENGRQTLSRVFDHLGVSDDFEPDSQKQAFNQRSSDPFMFARYYAPTVARWAFRIAPALHRLPFPSLAIRPEERRVLEEIYAGENERLLRLLDSTNDPWAQTNPSPV